MASDLDISYLGSDHYSSRNGGKIRRIVLHTCEGAGAGCISFLRHNSRKVSAHYVITSLGQVVQLVKEQNQANHVRCCNEDSVGIEHAGYAGKNAWTDAQLAASFALICDILKRHNIPLSAHSVQSHATLDPSRRSDPGPYYPWLKMMRTVRACLNQ